ncbi:TPA: hypothetical protein KDY51_004851 [Vibrio parahaemolyticus]|nr:hypothetical protein [Vibrio parahaemolyticus]
MKNIDLFNLAVGEILGTCYESFPEREMLSVPIIFHKIKGFYPEYTGEEATEFEFYAHRIIKSTVEWLRDSGYLWVEKEIVCEIYDFEGVVLTPKSLELLSALPESLDSTETVGEKLAKGLSKVGKDGSLHLIKTALAKGLELGLTSGT